MIRIERNIHNFFSLLQFIEFLINTFTFSHLADAFIHTCQHLSSKIREISAAAAGPGGLILVLRDVVHISVYINKCTITVLTKTYFCIYYYVCAMNIVTIMLNNR